MQRFAVILFTMLLFGCSTPEEKYDRETKQQEILTHEGIDSILNSFEQISYSDLDEHYKNYTESEPKFHNKLKDKKYFVIHGPDVHKFIVGHYRISSFLADDKYFQENRDHPSKDHTQYWLVDPQMLHMMLDFILILDKEGYNKYGFYVREAHRHPLLNRMRGGASQSQHIVGTAVDLVIQDINNDGKSTQDDKTIVLEIMEDLVGNKGGLGKYPGSMTVHFDTRGKRARWDSH